jgi:hypothetical protein
MVYPGNLELVPSMLWKVNSVSPSAGEGKTTYKIEPVVKQEITVNESQLIGAVLLPGDEVVKISEDAKGFDFVYRVEELRIAWDEDAAKGDPKAGKGKMLIMVRMKDEAGIMRDYRADEVRKLTEQDKKAGQGFWPTLS